MRERKTGNKEERKKEGGKKQEKQISKEKSANKEMSYREQNKTGTVGWRSVRRSRCR